MYGNDEDVYGDELDGDDDRNDGLNALVTSIMLIHRIFNGLLASTKTLTKVYIT